MSRYARCWTWVWSVVTTVGVGLAVLQLSPVAAAVTVLLLAPCVALVGLAAGAAHAPGGHPAARRGGDVAVGALRWGAVLLAAVTFTGGSPPVALLLGVLALVTWPRLVLWCRSGARVGGALPASPGRVPHAAPEGLPAPEGPLAPEELRGVVGALSDTELCAVWRSTFWELRRAHTDDERLTLVALRQTCLDELSLREPEALRAWLSSGARASSGPDRFLHGRPGEHGTHDAA